MRRGRVGVLSLFLLMVVSVMSASTPLGVLADGGPPPQFTECPAIGQDTGCAMLIVINPDQSASILLDLTQGPFDGAEDTLVGVRNRSAATIKSLSLSSTSLTPIFNLNGDGLCTAGNRPAGCPFGPTGYEGPGTTLTISGPNDGSIDFAGGLAPGASAYFSLESAPIASVHLAPRYVALGDSYSSGEGVPKFDSSSPSDPAAAACHRSSMAYARRIVGRANVPPSVEFGACSGAVIRDFFRSQRITPAPLPQLDRLGGDGPTLVTLGVGGNDIGFDTIGTACTSVTVFQVAEQNKKHADNCSNALNKPTDQLIKGLISGNLDTADNFKYSLPDLYQAIRSRAPLARVFVVGYPDVIPSSPSGDCKKPVQREDGSKATEGGGIVGIDFSLAKNDMVWMNKVLTHLNSTIESAALDAGFHYVDLQDAFAGHDMCGDQPWAHGVVLTSSDSPSEFSFHPTADGQAAMANGLAASVATGPSLFTILQQQIVKQVIAVEAAVAKLAVQANWPGSDVQVSLISPSGRVFDRTTQQTGVAHQLSANAESFTISDPEPGQWTVQLKGTSVPRAGEQVRLDQAQIPRSVNAPIAAIDRSADRGILPKTIQFDGSRSSSFGGGTIASFQWDFGDGTPPVSGPAVSHEFRTPGLHTVSLTVTDSTGLSDVADQDVFLTSSDQPPTAEFQWWLPGLSPDVQAPLTDVQFDASGSTDVDGTVVQFSWDFGDGTSGTGIAPRHSYQQAGQFPVRLTVTDDGGLQASACQMVTAGSATRSQQPCGATPGLPRAGAGRPGGRAAQVHSAEGWVWPLIPLAAAAAPLAPRRRRTPRPR